MRGTWSTSSPPRSPLGLAAYGLTDASSRYADLRERALMDRADLARDR